MSSTLPYAKRSLNVNSNPPSRPILRRKCACGQHAYGDCKECSKKKETLQRSRSADGDFTWVPGVVQDVLSSPGQPIDAATRLFMEPRFGHDFSKVRVHNDSGAAKSAELVSAEAYTYGQHLVFNSEKYDPHSLAGQRLLAHELSHVVQQDLDASVGSSAAEAEREAETNSSNLVYGKSLNVKSRGVGHAIQRKGNEAEKGKGKGKGNDNDLDEKAKKIIEAAKDTGQNLDQRAINAVKAILKEYYNPALVDEVVYNEDDKGLSTTYVGKGDAIKGKITVGKYFIETLGQFYARKVLQVGHELEHVQQQRQGMGGGDKRHEREFLAFHWEALAPEKAGTGKVTHATRRALIDEALKNYYCLSVEDQKKHAIKKDELLKRRDAENEGSGSSTNTPTSCSG